MVIILTEISCLILCRLNSRGNFWDITTCSMFVGQKVVDSCSQNYRKKEAINEAVSDYVDQTHLALDTVQ